MVVVIVVVVVAAIVVGDSGLYSCIAELAGLRARVVILRNCGE